MKKFITVLCGIYLILLGILIGTVTVLIYIVTQSKIPNTQIVQFPYIKTFVVIIGAIFTLLPLIIGIGIILKKNWARISVFLMSIFALFIGLVESLVIFIKPLPLNAKVNYQLIKLFFIGFFSIFFIAIPILFIIFFSRKSIKALFISRTEEEEKTNKPLGITFIAILSFLSGLSCVFITFQNFIDKFPLVGDIMLSGIGLKVYFLIYALIYIYIGIGLLKLSKTAWLTAILFKIFLILLGITNLFTISEATLSQITSSFNAKFGVSTSNFNMSLMYYRINLAIGLIIPIVIVIYLILKRSIFLNPPQLPEQFKQP